MKDSSKSLVDRSFVNRLFRGNPLLTRSRWVVLGLSIPPDDTIRPETTAFLTRSGDTSLKTGRDVFGKVERGEVEAISSYIRDKESILELERNGPIQHGG
jgi:hypothetical protein